MQPHGELGCDSLSNLMEKHSMRKWCSSGQIQAKDYKSHRGGSESSGS